jgi:hypothetical protein
MDNLEIVRERLSRLPRGNLTRKTIKGHTYTYLQWREDGYVRSRVVAIDELASLKRSSPSAIAWKGGSLPWRVWEAKAMHLSWMSQLAQNWAYCVKASPGGGSAISAET